MYYKVSKSNLSFNEAIEAFKNNNVISDGWSHIYDPKEKSLDGLKFSIEKIQSNDWNILTIDNEMNIKLEETRDIMHEIGLDIDGRFYDESRMDINSYWNLFEQQFLLVDDKIQADIIKWFYTNKYGKKE